MSITIGLGFAGAAVSDAEGPLPFCRCFLSPTRITACWRAARHCCVALRSTVRGRRRYRSSRILTAYPIPLLCAAGRKGVDESHPALSFLRKMAARAAQWLESTYSHQNETTFLSWLTPVLEILCGMVPLAKNPFPPPSLPGNSGVVLLRWAPEAKRRCG